MDAFINSFAPGAGTLPPELAGGDRLLEEARVARQRVHHGLPVKRMLLVGLRGAGTALLLFVNELQYVEEEQLAALITALHRVAQRRRPAMLVDAGLPQLRARMGRAMSFLERLFDYPEIGPLDVAAARLERFGDRGRAYLTRRFDRTEGGGRRHYSSALTLLDRRDGETAAQGASYLELVDLLVRQGAATRRDLEELWRRVVFYICVANTDDHLRNHGFLLEPKGWRLAPAFDVNPEPEGDGLHLNIDESDNRLDLELAMATAHEFRIDLPRAREIMVDVRAAACDWRRLARSLGLPGAEIERMEPAFRRAGPAP